MKKKSHVEEAILRETERSLGRECQTASLIADIGCLLLQQYTLLSSKVVKYKKR